MVISPQQLDLSPAGTLPVISDAQKFIIPVPAFAGGGEPLVYPPEHPDAGQPIVDWQGQPIGSTGIIFYNAKDRAFQAAAGDGSAVVIINQVTAAQSRQLLDKIRQYAQDPNALTLAQLKDILRYAREALGLVDMYNSDRDFVAQKMTPVASAATDIPAFGLHKRDDRDICRACYIPGSGAFQGSAMTPSLFDEGAVILKQGDDVRLIQPAVFVETYRHPDGAPVTLAELPVQRPAADSGV